MKRPTRQIVTLKDVARATGYSVNTVSRALRKMGDISAETQSNIKKVANEMGYINNTIASSLRLGRTDTIAVILGDISNPHFAIMTKEIELHARSLGYGSFLINTNENEEIERAAIQSALNKNVDGILLCPSQHSESNIRFLMDSGIPFVQIGRYFRGFDASYVVCNDELGGFLATNHLLNHGHQNILMLNGPSYISSAQERLMGYRRAFRERGISVQEKLIREVPITTGGCAQAIDSVMFEKLAFSAVFAFSDMIAWDAWTLLEARGLNIPNDISLIGFDNIQSRLRIPFQLSTISASKAEISTRAVDVLLESIKTGAKAAHVIDTELIPGETIVQK